MEKELQDKLEELNLLVNTLKNASWFSSEIIVDFETGENEELNKVGEIVIRGFKKKLCRKILSLISEINVIYKEREEKAKNKITLK